MYKRQVSARAIDNVGRISGTASKTALVDKVAPVISKVEQQPNSGYTEMSLSVTATDADSGVKGYAVTTEEKMCIRDRTGRDIKMALLFSAVTVTAGEDEIELLVGGIPREYDDLEGWSEFDDLMYFISEETEVSVRAEAYLYGEGESMRATPEEIDDLMQRIKDDSGFLNRCCSKLESVNFTFVWSPEELFDMPFGQMLM